MGKSLRSNMTLYLAKRSTGMPCCSFFRLSFLKISDFLKNQNKPLPIAGNPYAAMGKVCESYLFLSFLGRHHRVLPGVFSKPARADYNLHLSSPHFIRR